MKRDDRTYALDDRFSSFAVSYDSLFAGASRPSLRGNAPLTNLLQEQTIDVYGRGRVGGEGPLLSSALTSQATSSAPPA